MPERKINYERFQEKANAGILVKAPSWERLYIDSALALTDLNARLDAIDTKDKFKLHVQGASPQALMLSWLNELLRAFHAHHFVARRIVFDKFDGKKIEATLSGEPYHALKHGLALGPRELDASHLTFGDGNHPEPHFFIRITVGR